MRRSLSSVGTRITGIGGPCPECNVKMDLIWSVQRGALFWGCPDYPSCIGAQSFYVYGVFTADARRNSQAATRDY